MATKSSPSESTQRFANFLVASDKIRRHKSGPGCDASEEALLFALVAHWHQGKPLAVREAMALSHLASPSTLHRRIARLHDLGLISHVGTAGNLRIKHLVPTPKTLAYLDKLGQLLAPN